jgi:Family of unknown function (DUF6515)
MRQRDLTGIRWVAACACGLVCLQAQAQWGSIRGNNRSAQQFRTAPQARQAAPAAREGFREHENRGGEEHRFLPRTGREIEPEQHWREEAREHRHFDFDEDRRHAYFWSGITAGAFFNALPTGYMPIYVGGNPYYYYQGAYYEPEASGYVAVTPPIGAVVPTLPPGAEPVVVGQTVYYYAGGAFYLQQPQGFAVVAPPLGVTVTSLPPGATPVYIRGGLYYQAGGAYFLPNMQGGVTVYTTVQP